MRPIIGLFSHNMPPNVFYVYEHLYGVKFPSNNIYIYICANSYLLLKGPYSFVSPSLYIFLNGIIE